jgi:hypothetical protein
MRFGAGLSGWLAAAVLATIPGLVAAQSGWEVDLAAEIDLAKGCKIAFLSHVVERKVDNKDLVMAKAHCEDRRVFDAMRPDAFEPFRFNECQADSAQSC